MGLEMFKAQSTIIALTITLATIGSASAQAVQEAAVKTAENTAALAQKLANPVADMVSIPF